MEASTMAMIKHVLGVFSTFVLIVYSQDGQESGRETWVEQRLLETGLEPAMRCQATLG